MSVCWECTVLDQFPAEFNAKRVIDVQKTDGDSTNGSSADKVRSVPAEMAGPFVPPRIKQGGQLA